MTFADPFFGNPGVIERLGAKLHERRLPHAMIFTGPEGVGKRTCAMRLAKALNCRPGERMPCGACPDCRKIENSWHPDVRVLGLEADASQIKIEQIRELRSTLEFEPLEGAAKVYIIDPAERMNPAAANGLLKALEEPPPETYFFLITANAAELLATIRSRSQVYHFAPLSIDAIRQTGVEDELLIRWSQGSVGRALSTDAEELQSSRDRVLDFLESVVAARDDALAELLGASAELSRSKEDYPDRIRVLGVLLSDLLFLKQDMGHRVVNVDIPDRLAELESRISLDRIVQIGECLKFIEANLKHYLNRQMMTDQLALVSNPITSEILDDKPVESR